MDEQVTALIRADGETSWRSGSEGVEVAGFGISGAGEGLRKIVAKRSASASPTPPPVKDRPALRLTEGHPPERTNALP